MSVFNRKNTNLITIIAVTIVFLLSIVLLWTSYHNQRDMIEDRIISHMELRNSYALKNMKSNLMNYFSILDMLASTNQASYADDQKFIGDVVDNLDYISSHEYFSKGEYKPVWAKGLVPGKNVEIISYSEQLDDGKLELVYANWNEEELVNALKLDYSATEFTKFLQSELFYTELPLALRIKSEGVFFNYNDVSNLSKYNFEENALIKIKDKSYYPSRIVIEDIGLEIFAYDDVTDLHNQLIINYIGLFIIIIIIESVLVHLIQLIYRKLSNPFSPVINQMKKFIDSDDTTRVLNVNTTYDHKIYDIFNNYLNEFEVLKAEDIAISNEIEESKNNIAKLNEDVDVVKSKIHEMYNRLSLLYSKNDMLIRSIDDLYMVLDIQGNILSVNDSGEKLLGTEKGYLVSRNFKDILYENMNEAELMNLIFSLVDYEQGKRNVWLKNISTGKRIIMNVNSIVSYSNNGEIKQIKILGRSISTEVELHNRMARKRKELNFINTVNSSLISNWNVDELLDNITQSIKALFSSDILCSIRLVEENQLELHSYLKGKYTDIFDDDLRIDDPRLSSVFQKLEMTILERKEYSQVAPDLSQIIVIPLVTSDHCIGTLMIGKEEAFIDKEINLMNAISNQISIVIERARLYDKLKEEYFRTTQVLAAAIEAKDEYTEGHSVRVSQFAELIATHMDFSPEFVENVTIAGILHDVGKIPIDDSILTKKGRLTTEEYEEMQLHPSYGRKILKPIGLAEEIIDGVYLHHMRYDLKGYPKEVTINELPEIAEIIGVADAFDAITSSRSYSSAESLKFAIDELNKYKGTQFSPRVVEVIETIYEKSPQKLHAIIE